MRHQKHTIAALAVCLLALSVSGFAGAISHAGGTIQPVPGPRSFASTKLSPIIYEQDPDFGNVFASQNDTTTGGFGNFATTFDNFTLSSSYNVDEFQWAGGYFNPQVQGLITGFTLTFYADAGGSPGATLATYSGPGTFGETFIGTDSFGDPMFLYDGLLGTPFAASANTQYWVSIVPDLGFPPQWGWGTSADGDGVGYQVFFGAGGAVASDFAFALNGTAQTSTPEPGSLVLLGTGLIGLAGVIRRKLS
jgi:PEP-CTERM motif